MARLRPAWRPARQVRLLCTGPPRPPSTRISTDELCGGEHMGPCRGLDFVALGTLLEGELFDIESRQTEAIVMRPVAMGRAGSAVAGFAKVVSGLPHSLDMRIARKAFTQ